MKSLKFSIFILCLGLFASCAKKPTASQLNIKPNDFFELKLGNTAIVPEDKFKLTFKAVPEDSRCPKFVNCIQEGQIRVTFVAVLDGKSQPPIELVKKASDKMPAAAKIGNYEIQVYDVMPNTESGKQINPADYVARMTVKKAETAEKAADK